MKIHDFTKAVLKIESDNLQHEMEQEDVSKDIENNIPEEKLCIKCRKEQKSFDDKDFCIKCRQELQEEAEGRAEEIKEELAKDTKFIELTSEAAAIAYVKKNYYADKKKNKYIYLKTIAKEAYQLKKNQL